MAELGVGGPREAPRRRVRDEDRADQLAREAGRPVQKESQAVGQFFGLHGKQVYCLSKRLSIVDSPLKSRDLGADNRS